MALALFHPLQSDEPDHHLELPALLLRDHDRALAAALEGPASARTDNGGRRLGMIQATGRRFADSAFSGQEAVAYEYLVSQFSHHVPGPELRSRAHAT